MTTSAGAILDPSTAGVTVNFNYAGTDLTSATLQGFEVYSAGTAAGDWPVQVVGGSGGIVIDGNSIVSLGIASQGISFGAGDFNDITIQNNTFLYDETGGDVAVNFNPESTDGMATDVLIYNNTFTQVGPGVTRAMKFGNVTNLMVIYNTLTSPTYFHVGGGGVASSNVDIYANTFDSTSTVTFIREGAGTLSDLDVTQNDFNGTVNGVNFYAEDGDPSGVNLQTANLPGTIEINENNFHNYGAGENAIRIGDTAAPLAITVDAENNYWGNAYGPTVAGGPAYGAGINNDGGGTVDYQPWWQGINNSPGTYTGSVVGVWLDAEWYLYSGGTVTGSWDTLVPGEKYKVYLKVTNNGLTAAAGTMDVNAYFNNAQTSPGGVGDVITYDDVAVNLAPGAYAYYGSGTWTVPANDPGENWYFVGDVTDLTFVDPACFSGVVASPVQEVAWGFGANIGSDNRTVPYLGLPDAVGGMVYFTTTGASTGAVDYQTTPANGYDVHVANTDATTKVKVYYNAVISGFDSDGAINYFSAPNSTVIGQVDIGAAGNANAIYYYVGQMTSGGQLNAGVINYIYTRTGGLNADVNLAGGAVGQTSKPLCMVILKVRSMWQQVMFIRFW